MAARGKKLLKVKRRAEFKHSRNPIHRGDQVQIIAGNERGKVGRVLRVDPSRQRLVVEGVNKRFKHVKKSQQNPQGGRVESESSLALSNVLLWCEKCARGVRHGHRLDGDRKHRTCVKCSSDIG